MNLGIISDSGHYCSDAGVLYNTHPVLARQIDYWASMFEEVVICAPLLGQQPSATAGAYGAKNIRLIPIRPAGGNAIGAKLKLASRMPSWWKAIRRLLSEVDLVHIRCPANVSIVALIALFKTRHRREAVYTGWWGGPAKASVTYRAQRWYLKHFFSGPVAVYGKKPTDPEHIVDSFSPSYTFADWKGEIEQVDARLRRLEERHKPLDLVRLLTVGSLSKLKNQEFILEGLSHLRNLGIRFRLDILGEGVQRQNLEQRIDALGLQNEVVMHGHLGDEEVRLFYRAADIVVQAPLAEGYGKVPHEAMFFGAVPIISDVNLVRQIIDDGTRGRCFPLDSPEALASEIANLARDPKEMGRLIRNGRAYARTLTLEAWREHLRAVLTKYCGLKESDLCPAHRRTPASVK